MNDSNPLVCRYKGQNDTLEAAIEWLCLVFHEKKIPLPTRNYLYETLKETLILNGVPKSEFYGQQGFYGKINDITDILSKREMASSIGKRKPPLNREKISPLVKKADHNNDTNMDIISGRPQMKFRKTSPNEKDDESLRSKAKRKVEQEGGSASRTIMDWNEWEDLKVEVETLMKEAQAQNHVISTHVLKHLAQNCNWKTWVKRAAKEYCWTETDFKKKIRNRIGNNNRLTPRKSQNTPLKSAAPVSLASPSLKASIPALNDKVQSKERDLKEEEEEEKNLTPSDAEQDQELESDSSFNLDDYETDDEEEEEEKSDDDQNDAEEEEDSKMDDEKQKQQDPSEPTALFSLPDSVEIYQDKTCVFEMSFSLFKGLHLAIEFDKARTSKHPKSFQNDYNVEQQNAMKEWKKGKDEWITEKSCLRIVVPYSYYRLVREKFRTENFRF